MTIRRKPDLLTPEEALSLLEEAMIALEEAIRDLQRIAAGDDE